MMGTPPLRRDCWVRRPCGGIVWRALAGPPKHIGLFGVPSLGKTPLSIKKLSPFQSIPCFKKGVFVPENAKAPNRFGASLPL